MKNISYNCFSKYFSTKLTKNLIHRNIQADQIYAVVKDEKFTHEAKQVADKKINLKRRNNSENKLRHKCFRQFA